MARVFPDFADIVDTLPALLDQLKTSAPLTRDRIAGLRSGGVYSFSEGGEVLYVGRTRDFRQRHKAHCHQSSGENKAAFAFRLARLATGKTKASYKAIGSRKDLMNDLEFSAAFESAKDRIKSMDIRFVETDDAITQTLLEIYASMVLKSTHNSFETS